MAQSNFEERIDTYEIESTNVMTGDRDRSRYLYYQLKMSMAKAKQIDIIVSFLMESGVRMLLNDMKRALDRGVKIRILTGNYLGITQPSALYLIKSELGDRVDLRLYNETSRSFHPKSYIFHYESSNEIYIGSSNISKSALTSGIEWNYRFSDTLDKKNYELFYATFEDLFLNHSIIIDDEELKRYSKAWKKPAVSRDLAKYDATEDGEDRNAENVRMLYRPRGAQIEALYTSVIFVASDNGNTPNVRMYPFFELWSELEFSLPQFEELFYSYKKIIEEVEKELGMKVSKLTAKTHNKNEKNKTILSKYSKQVLEKYQGNLLFEALCKEDFIAYLKKPNVKNVQKIFKITEIEGILTAYKLFYVGCSRARKNLIIMVEKNKIMNFKEKFVDKAKKIGFTVLS